MEPTMDTLSAPSVEDLPKIVETSAIVKNENSSTAFTNTFSSITENINSNISSDKFNLLSIPSTEELKKIIETSALLNVFPLSDKTRNPLNFLDNNTISNVNTDPPEIEKVEIELSRHKYEELNIVNDKIKQSDVIKIDLEQSNISQVKGLSSIDNNKIDQQDMDIVKIAKPEIEEIILEDEKNFSVSFHVSNTQIVQDIPFKTAINNEIEMLVIKKKKSKKYFKKSADIKRKRDCNCECKCKQNKEIKSKFATSNNLNNLNNVNILYGSNTFKTTPEIHAVKQGNAYQENDSRNGFNKDIDEFSDVNSNDNSNKIDRIEYAFNPSNIKSCDAIYDVKESEKLTNLDSFEEGRVNIESDTDEPPFKKIMYRAITPAKNCVATTLNSKDTNKTCLNKPKLPSGAGIKINAKTIPKDEDHSNISSLNRKADKSLSEDSLTLNQKKVLIYPPTMVKTASKKIKASTISHRTSTITREECLGLPISAARIPKLTRKEISSNNTNIQFPMQTGSFIKISPVQNTTNINDETTALVTEDLPKRRLLSSKMRNPDSNQDQSKNAPPLLDFRRRGISHMPPVSNYNKNLQTHVIEWNPHWFILQNSNGLCYPIWEKYKTVKEVYENESEYYSTYFPLHLLSVWLKVTDSWIKSPPCFDAVLENREEKASFIKISLSAELNVADYPKSEDIVLCKIGIKEQFFGQICSVIVNDYGPSKTNHNHSTKKKVKLVLFCAEILNVTVLTVVKVQILFNLRVALLQYDALKNFNSTLFKYILNPKRYVSKWKLIFLRNSLDKRSVRNSIRSVIESMTSRKVTIVDTSSPSFSIVSMLATVLKRRNRPGLIVLKSEAAFLEMSYTLKHFNPILAIKNREVELPEDLRKYTLEERSKFKRNIFTNSHLTLTLLTSIYFGNFASVFDDQNLIGIIHDAHLCTEVETTHVLHYGVKNLVLIGDQEAEIKMDPLLKHYKYDVSLFKRIISGYAAD